MEHYRRLESRRHGEGATASRWELTTYDAEGSLVELPALGIALPFDEICVGTDARRENRAREHAEHPCLAAPTQ